MRELERDPTDSFDPAALRAPLAVVGAGRVGRSLARAALDAGLDVELAGRRDAVAAAEGARVALLCVPDAAIGQACETIAAAIPPLRFVGHVSGATPLTALAAARRRGAEAFCIHPLQTIPDGDTEPRRRARARSRARAPKHPRSRARWRRGSGCAPSRSPTTSAPPTTQRRAWPRTSSSRSRNRRRSCSSAPASRTRGSCWPRSCSGPPPTGPSSAARRSRARSRAATEETVDRHLDAIAAASPELADLYRALAERTRALARGAEVAA